MRLFVAVYPPPAALDHLAAAIAGLRLGAAAAAGTNVRLAARPLWHLTLAFLGEVPDDAAPRAAAAIQAAAIQAAASRAPGGGAPGLRLAGGGKFGGRRFATLWVGVAGDVHRLRSLADVVRPELRRARLPYDRKPFRPHLTFARPGERLSAADVATDLDTMRRYEGPGWTLSAVCVVRSQLGPKPVHERIATVPLA